MRVLIACEYSGIVREAFKKQGHDAWSCDLIPTTQPGQHIQADVRTVFHDNWDLMIAHPPCNFLSYAGNRWFKVQPDRMEKAKEAFLFFMDCVNAPIPMIAVENPRGLTWQWYRKPDQVIQPYHFGHPVTKATCLWLKNLPPLLATLICPDPFVNWARNKKGDHSAKTRSITFPGIAEAMSIQWGSALAEPISQDQYADLLRTS